MSILQQIVAWSASRPLWQRDALRRIVTQVQLTPQDIDDLFVICLQQRGVDTPGIGAVVPRPIADRDIPQAGSSVNTLRLKGVRNPRDINAIAADSHLDFAESGLTVVYGDNATGKSGYTRLLKQLCRARGETEPILPDVFGPTQQPRAEADVDYSLNAADLSIHWVAGGPTTPEFKEVSVFDEHSAGVYVDENCEVAYLPFGLDVLPRLADLCSEVARRIQSEINQLARNAFVPMGYLSGTHASSIVERLDQRNIQDEIVGYAIFDPRDQMRLDEVSQTLARLSVDNPLARAAELRARAARVQIIRETFDQYRRALGDEPVQELGEAITRSRIAESAAGVAHTQAFSSEPLPGVGTEIWRRLWEAARQYSQLQAREGAIFPPRVAGELCVLCFQPLDQTSVDRFQRFEAFIRTTVQAEAERERRGMEELRRRIENLSPTPFLTPDMLEELSAIDSQSTEALRAIHETLFARRARVLSATESESLGSMPPIPNYDLSWLHDLEARLRSEAEVLASANDPTERERLDLELGQLQGKRQLTENRDALLAEVERRSRITALRASSQDADTTGITRRNSELTDSALIGVLGQRFASHLQALRVEHTLATISRAPGEHGTAYHRVEIRARRPVRASDVLSRGEHRAIALAAFLAELELQQSTSTVVFDDPVSSLDQDRRRYVAGSISSLASRRPVVVFTHDLYFLYLLRQQAELQNVSIAAQFLRREGGRVGVAADGFPWAGQSVGERIGVLKQLRQQADALSRRGAVAEYEREAKEIYGLLRAAWERAVEEVLLNGAITRFSPEVQTRKLRNLAGVAEDQLERLENAMTKTSRWLTGHDTAVTASDAVPDAVELEADIVELENWVRELRAHHRRA